MRSRCTAEGERRELIETRIAETRSWLRDLTGHPGEDHADAWINRYYQAANRLAFLRFFSDVAGEKAWLLNVLIVDDPDLDARIAEAEWREELPKINAQLGINEQLIPELGSAFIEGRPRSELV